jgi:hypothetical protein
MEKSTQHFCLLRTLTSALAEEMNCHLNRLSILHQSLLLTHMRTWLLCNVSHLRYIPSSQWVIEAQCIWEMYVTRMVIQVPNDWSKCCYQKTCVTYPSPGQPPTGWTLTHKSTWTYQWRPHVRWTSRPCSLLAQSPNSLEADWIEIRCRTLQPQRWHFVCSSV